MQTFAEQLSAARKAAGMTQAELADALQVTRTAVSSWERGRTQPDLNMVRKLSQTLKYDFVTGAGVENTTVQPDAGKAAAAAASAQKSASKKWVIPAAICAAVAVLAVCFVLLILPAIRQNQAMAKLPPAVKIAPEDLLLKEPEGYTISWFKQGNIRAEGEPWLEISTSVTCDTANSSEPQWCYAVDFSEAAGQSFVLDYVNEYIFWAEDKYHLETVPGANIWEDEKHPGSWKYTGGMPVQNIICSGFQIFGHDAAGNKISFRTYVDFTTAPRE